MIDRLIVFNPYSYTQRLVLAENCLIFSIRLVSFMEYDPRSAWFASSHTCSFDLPDRSISIDHKSFIGCQWIRWHWKLLVITKHGYQPRNGKLAAERSRTCVNFVITKALMLSWIIQLVFFKTHSLSHPNTISRLAENPAAPSFAMTMLELVCFFVRSMENDPPQPVCSMVSKPARDR